jgi:hypothetical protein
VLALHVRARNGGIAVGAHDLESASVRVRTTTANLIVDRAGILTVRGVASVDGDAIGFVDHAVPDDTVAARGGGS